MAIETRTINGSLTEIYVGGGNFITQSFPTNFHQFYKRKILTASEEIGDYKEVTASQKTQLEEADAKWIEPSNEFIYDCESMGAVYNSLTGFFELNGLNDISYAEMFDIYRFTSGPIPNAERAYFSCKFRTNLYPIFSAYQISLSGIFGANNILEVAVLPQYYEEGVSSTKMRESFYACNKLREIKNIIIAPQRPTNYDGLYDTFIGCVSLETVWLKKVYDSVNLKWSSKLKLECIKYLIENANNPKEMTVTLHKEVYDQITDEIFSLAAEKQITLATTN